MTSDAATPEETSPLFAPFIACRTGFSRIGFFREVATAGQNVAGQDYFDRHYARLWELAKNGTPDVLARSRSMLGQVTRSAIQEAQASIDAASLVFAHSILDDVASECCSVSFQAAPGDWSSVLAQRRVPLEQVKGQSYDQILLEVGGDYIKQLKREPLMKRLDVINAKCQPVPGFSWRGVPFRYDRDRIEMLDTRRHEIIHHPSIGKEFPDIEGDISFLHGTSQFVMWMTCERYGIQDELIRFGS